MPSSRQDRAARAALRRLVRTVGEPHRSTSASGAPRTAATYAVGSGDGIEGVDCWAILTLGRATTASDWGGDYLAMGSLGLLVAEY